MTERTSVPRRNSKKNPYLEIYELLMEKYDLWTVTVHKGDTVKVMRGGYAGHTAKVTSVNNKKRVIFIEKVTGVKSDGKETPRPIHPSNVLVTKLDLTDPWRKRRLEKKSK